MPILFSSKYLIKNWWVFFSREFIISCIMSCNLHQIEILLGWSIVPWLEEYSQMSSLRICKKECVGRNNVHVHFCYFFMLIFDQLKLFCNNAFIDGITLDFEDRHIVDIEKYSVAQHKNRQLPLINKSRREIT